MIQLLQSDSHVRVDIPLRIPAQCLRDSFILIMKDRRQRPKQVRSKNGALGIGQTKRKFFDFSDSGHRPTVAIITFDASLHLGRRALVSGLAVYIEMQGTADAFGFNLRRSSGLYCQESVGTAICKIPITGNGAALSFLRCTTI